MRERADRELVLEAQGGDRAAIGELFSRYWRAARAAAFGITGEFASAEDAASEAFQQALAGLNSLRDPGRFGPWLRTIVVRTARLRRRRGDATIDAPVCNFPDRNERPDEALARLQLEAFVRQATHELPEPLREAMTLVYFEGYGQDAAARFLEIPPGTLRRRLHDGRARLRIQVEQLLHGSKPMNEEREREIQRLKTMFDSGEIYEGLRGSFALRPPPRDLIDKFLRRQRQIDSNGPDLMRMVERLLRVSERASDLKHPVGSVAAAIRNALPDFQEWALQAGEAALRFMTGKARPVLPPGFVEGRPGSFLRATRALVRPNESGRAQSIYELLQDSPGETAFREAMENTRLSDVLDLTWMVSGSLELWSVEELLERVSSAVLPGAPIRFSTYDEPRYRSALELHVGDSAARAASGGVLAEWPGRPNGVEAAHVRIFLEPWATVQSGQVIEFVLPTP